MNSHGTFSMTAIFSKLSMNQSHLPSCQWSAPPAHRAEPIIRSQPIKLTAYRFSPSRKPSLHKVKVICWMTLMASDGLPSGVTSALLPQTWKRAFSQLDAARISVLYDYEQTFTKCVELFAARLEIGWGENWGEGQFADCPHTKTTLELTEEKKILVFFIQTSKKEKQFHLFIRFNFIYTAFLTIKIVSRCFIKLDKLQNRRRREIRHEWKCISQDLQTQACLLFLTALWNLEYKIPKYFPHSTGTILSHRRPRIKLNGKRRRGSYKICIDRVWAEGYFKALPCDVCDVMLKWPRGIPFGVKKGY